MENHLATHGVRDHLYTYLQEYNIPFPDRNTLLENRLNQLPNPESYQTNIQAKGEYTRMIRYIFKSKEWTSRYR